MQNNIKPCWWGSHLWQTIYFMVATYPDNPTKEQIESMKCFLRALRLLLPCEGCQESYSKFSCEPNTNIDDNENFKSKDNLIKFIFDLRTKVNGKLSHYYCIDLKYFKKKLSCMVINDNNNYDGRVCDMVEAPFISHESEKKVYTYLKLFTELDYSYTKNLLEISKKFMKNPVFDYNDKFFKFMYKRHKKCRKIINKIYHRMSEGKYDITQSFLIHDKKYHDILLYYGCSIIHTNNLDILLDSVINNKKNKFN